MQSKAFSAKRIFNADVGIFLLAIVFIGVMHTVAFEDRMVLIPVLSGCCWIGLCSGETSRHRPGIRRGLRCCRNHVRTALLRSTTRQLAPHL